MRSHYLHHQSLRRRQSPIEEGIVNQHFSYGGNHIPVLSQYLHRHFTPPPERPLHPRNAQCTHHVPGQAEGNCLRHCDLFSLKLKNKTSTQTLERLTKKFHKSLARKLVNFISQILNCFLFNLSF